MLSMNTQRVPKICVYIFKDLEESLLQIEPAGDLSSGKHLNSDAEELAQPHT